MTRPTVPNDMRAAAIDAFGGPEVLTLHTLPVPDLGADEVLIQLGTAGVGVWDAYVREGQMVPGVATFPLILGFEGAGTVVLVGENVTGFGVGDKVYACAEHNAKGGLYAEYAAVPQDNVAPVPGELNLTMAGGMPVDAVTALRGLDDTLKLRAGETLLIFGASGGVGHLALQLAKIMGARVLAVASGLDGVALTRQLGADAAIDGHAPKLEEEARAFAPNGFDAMLALAGGEAASRLAKLVRVGGRVAHPNGVPPAQEQGGVPVLAYDGRPGREVLDRLNRLIERGPFTVHIDRSYPLSKAADAHRHLNGHYLGKIVLSTQG